MKKTLYLSIFFILLFSCKNADNNSLGNFIIKNNSNKVIEFVWITEEGQPWPTAQSINISCKEIYEIKGLKEGIYDIAVDFEGEYEMGSNNSKFDKAKCLNVEKGITKIWIVNENGIVNRE